MGWIAGVIITWTLALIPVLILRYKVLKRPMSKWPAVGIGVLTALVHVLVFALLGAKRLGPVGAVVGFAAFEILRSGSVKQERKKRVDGGEAENVASGGAPGSLYAEGCRLADAGQNAAAVEVFAKCTAVDPANADAWHNRGCCLYELGLLSEAIASYSQALSLRPRDSVTLFARGLAHEAAGDAVGAAEDFEKYLRGSGEVDRKKTGYARETIARIRNQRVPVPTPAESPAGPSPCHSRTESAGPAGQTEEEGERAVILRLGGGVRRMSVRDFRAAACSGQVLAETEVMSTFLFGDGHWRKAGDTRIWRAAHAAPDRVASPGREPSQETEEESHRRPPSHHEATKHPQDADDAERLLANDPDVWLRKGQVLAERREWRDAQTCLSMALTLKPNGPDALFWLARTEDALGDADSARKHFGQFLV
jgi:tetratricopeptide (TPR) repeat protein